LVIVFDGSLVINIKFSVQYTISNLIINLFLFIFIIVLQWCSSFVFIVAPVVHPSSVPFPLRSCPDLPAASTLSTGAQEISRPLHVSTNSLPLHQRPGGLPTSPPIPSPPAPTRSPGLSTYHFHDLDLLVHPQQQSSFIVGRSRRIRCLPPSPAQAHAPAAVAVLRSMQPGCSRHAAGGQTHHRWDQGDVRGETECIVSLVDSFFFCWFVIM
jgi:hypothetical protein